MSRITPKSPTCGKVAYASERDAKRAMRGLSARLRTYRCKVCGELHLTNVDASSRDRQWLKASERGRDRRTRGRYT
jgi:hypothetical protein